MFFLEKEKIDFIPAASAASSKDENLILNKESFLIQGSFFKVSDGDDKNSFWSNIFISGYPPKSVSFMEDVILDDIRYCIYQNLIVNKDDILPMTDFYLFEGKVIFDDEDYSVLPRDYFTPSQEKALDASCFKRFGVFAPHHRKGKGGKIVCRNLCGVEEALSEESASLYLTVMTLNLYYERLYERFFCNADGQRVPPVDVEKVVQNIDFVKDLAMAVYDGVLVYRLLD